MLSSDHYNIVKNSLLGQMFDGFEYPCNVISSAYRIVYVNKAFCKFYGYKLEQILGLSPKVLLPRNYQPKKILELQHLIIIKKKPFWGLFSNVHASGRELTVFLKVVPIITEASPHPVAHLSICCDVPKKEAMLLSLLSHISNFTYSYDSKVKRITPKISSYRRGDRQSEIIKLTKLGYSTKEIAGMMGITTSTVGFVKWKLSIKKNSRI